MINNTKLDTIIRITGTANVLNGDVHVPFLEANDFKGINLDGSLRDIREYNIEILGAKHSDFDRVSNPQVNLFMRDLNLISNNPVRLEEFLTLGTTQGVIYDLVSKRISVNPEIYKSPYGDRI